jgi:hypothetical protein
VLLSASGCESEASKAFHRERAARALPGCQSGIAKYGRRRPGYLSEKEFATLRWDALLTALNLTGQTRISESDFADAFPNTPEFNREAAQSKFRSSDIDHSGFLEPADIEAQERARFQRGDRNHDGWWSLDECVHEPDAPGYLG